MPILNPLPLYLYTSRSVNRESSRIRENSVAFLNSHEFSYCSCHHSKRLRLKQINHGPLLMADGNQ